MPDKKGQGFSLERIKAYYKDNRISALKFDCKNYEKCLGASENQDNFMEAREPYIGKNYENPSIPRLLFMSLDPGDPGGAKKDEKEKRTIEYLRENKSYIEEIDKRKMGHWYRTHQFAWVIFDELNNQFGLNLDIGRTNEKMFFKTRKEIGKIRGYFAHTNSAKCCENKKGSKQATKEFFTNCRGFIPEEIRIFNPHILVTQGEYAKKAAESALKIKNSKTGKKISKASDSDKIDCITVEFNEGLPALWIHHYHPANYGSFNKINRPYYRDYAKEAAKFINKYYPEFLASR